MSSRALLHADHAEPASRPGHFRPGAPAVNAVLARAIARGGLQGDYTGPDSLVAVTSYARRSTVLGASPAQVASGVRRAFAAVAPAHMTIVTFETIARTLVRHALSALLDD